MADSHRVRRAAVQLSAVVWGTGWRSGGEKCAVIRDGARQSKPERAALSDLGVDPQLAAVLLDDLAHRGQADAVAGDAVAAKTHEEAENLVTILGPDAGSVVAHEKAVFAIGRFAADVNMRSRVR